MLKFSNAEFAGMINCNQKNTNKLITDPNPLPRDLITPISSGHSSTFTRSGPSSGYTYTPDDPLSIRYALNNTPLGQWTAARGPMNNGRSLAPSIAHPLVRVQYPISTAAMNNGPRSNGTTDEIGDSIPFSSEESATFTASTYSNDTRLLHITATAAGSSLVGNGMQFIRLTAPNVPLDGSLPFNPPRNLTITLSSCNLEFTFGTGQSGVCLMDQSISIPLGSTITAVRRKVNTPGTVLSTVAIFGGHVYVSGQNNATLYALTPSGSTLWLYRRNSGIRSFFSSPALYVSPASLPGTTTTTTRTYLGLSSTTTTATTTTYLPAVPTSIYTVSTDGLLLALDPYGTRKWRLQLRGPVNILSSAPVVLPSQVLVASGAKILYGVSHSGVQVRGWGWGWG